MIEAQASEAARDRKRHSVPRNYRSWAFAKRQFWSLSFSFVVATGCAGQSYHYGLKRSTEPKPSLDSVNAITFGGEHSRLDRCEHIIHYPVDKLKSWFRRRNEDPDKPMVDPAELRRVALFKSQEYLMLNELTDVRIDVREYDPAEQWRRLRANDRIHPFWKYTAGSITHLQYAWLPGRVFRYDKFNPYTNTLSINSTAPSMALYEAAEAKIVRDQRYPGTYLAACYLPVVPLVKDVQVANDVLSYARLRQEWELEKQLTPQIYGAFGSDVVSQATSLVPGASYMPFYYKPLLSAAGGVAGRAGGQMALKEREFERKLMSMIGSPAAPAHY